MSNPTIHRVKRNTFLLSLIFAATTLLHLARDLWFAGRFGTGDAIEAFELVFVLPNLLARFAGGGMLPAIVPRATEYLGASGAASRDFWRFHRSLLLRLLAIASVLVVILEFAAPSVVRLLAHGSKQSVLSDALPLFRVLIPSVFITLLSGICIAMVHALQRYTLSSLAGLAAPAVFLAMLFLFSPGQGIQAASWGFVAGQGAAALVLIVYLVTVHRPRAELSAAPVRPPREMAGESLGAIGLVLLGWFSGIANLQIDLSMASTLGEGSVPSLRYAFRWVQLPAGLFFSTVGVVMLPTLSRAISDGDSELVARTLRYACRVVAAVLLPAAVGAAVLAPTLIALLYERGAFAPADTLRTATALRAYAPAIVAFGYLNVALSALHAHRQQRTAAIIGVASIVLNATLNALLMSRYQTAGIAMSSSIVTTLNVVAVALLRPELRGLFRARGLGSSLVRACIGCAVMAFVLVLLPREAMLGKSWGVGDLLLRVAVGTLSYAAILWALRGGELRELQDAILKRSG